jgi:hypothetical protein
MSTDFFLARQQYDLLPDNLKSPYHNPDYVALDAQSKVATQPIFFIFKRDSEIYYHPLHKVYTKELNVVDFESARGYGGPISTTSDKEFLQEAFLQYQQFSSDHNAVVEFIRFSPILSNQDYYGGSSWFDRATCAIDLSSYALKNNSHGAISNINKAMKNNCKVIITPSPSSLQIEKFNNIYHLRMIELKADNQYIFNEEYIRGLFDGKNELAIAELNGEIVAASIFLRSAQWIEYHLSAANDIGRKFGVVNLILHAYAMQNQKASSILHLGGGTDQLPDNKLLLFKQAMGKLSKAFHIGKSVHQPDHYSQLRQEFVGKDNRVIFYRS